MVGTAADHMTGVKAEQHTSFEEQFPAWYAVHVKSRHEFVAAGELVRRGVETFVPALKQLRQWKDRKKLVAFPLFPGYAFVRVFTYPGAFTEVLKTRGIAGFVTLEPGMPARVDPDEIDSLRLLTECGGELEVYPELKEGTRVRVCRGPLTNAEGILTGKTDGSLFVVNVELLGRSVAVKIAPHDVSAL